MRWADAIISDSDEPDIPVTLAVTPEMMAKYEPVIGLEVHVQLKTADEGFLRVARRNSAIRPIRNTCPVCLGLPGALPVLNRAARGSGGAGVAALWAARFRSVRVFARKNYFYPDLPKGYQISMYELPLALEGALEIEVEGAKKKIGITRLHMEEDAAKNLHEGFPDSDRWSYIDYNRCGMPLIEIVSEPDMRSPAEAYAYLTTLKQILEYTDVSDCNMEEGSLRCDANVSVRLRGAPEIRHQGGSEESEFVPLPGARAGIRNRAADRRAGIRRHASRRRRDCGTWRRAAPSRCARRNSRTITDIFPIPICCRLARAARAGGTGSRAKCRNCPVRSGRVLSRVTGSALTMRAC